MVSCLYSTFHDPILAIILLAVEIVPIHSNPKRKRGNDLATSLALWVSVSLYREQYRNRLILRGYAARRCPWAVNCSIS